MTNDEEAHRERSPHFMAMYHELIQPALSVWSAVGDVGSQGPARDRPSAFVAVASVAQNDAVSDALMALLTLPEKRSDIDAWLNDATEGGSEWLPRLL